MSYGFDLNFKAGCDMGDAFAVAHAASEAVYRNRKQFLESEDVFIPSVRYPSLRDDHQLARAENRLWLEKLMKMNFIFWPQYGLLALVGAGWPKEALRDFDASVCFQNSCDQDYDFSEWKFLPHPLQNIVSECRGGDVETVKKYLNLGRERYPMEIEQEELASEESLAYYRRSAAYNGVYATLRLDDWLWGVDNPIFVRFSISPLNSQERAYDAYNLLNPYEKKV